MSFSWRLFRLCSLAQADEDCGSDNVILHCRRHLRFVCTGRQVKRDVESVQLEVIMVRAAEVFWARALVSVCSAIGNTLDASLRDMAGRHNGCGRRNVENQPVCPWLGSCIAVFDDEYKTLGFCGKAPELERGTDILPGACVGSRDTGAIKKRGACDSHLYLLFI